MREQVLVEARADFAGILQMPVFVITEQKRAEADARALRVRVAADHQFLARRAFELEPFAGAGARVARRRALGDESFPALVARCREPFAAIAVAMRREMQPRLPCECLPQRALALPECETGQVVTVKVQDVEQVQIHRDLAHQRRARIGDAQPSLEFRETAQLAVEGDDFAVGDDRAVDRLFDHRHQLRKNAVEPQVVARAKPDAAAVSVHDAANAVEFSFIDPVVGREWFVRERRQHRRDALRHRFGLHAPAIVGSQ